MQCGRIAGSWAQARAAQRTLRARMTTRRRNARNVRACDKYKWLVMTSISVRGSRSAGHAARIASTTNGDPQFVRCVHPRTDAAPWEPPCAPPPAVLRGRSTSMVRTCAQHPGPFVRPGRRPRSNAGTPFACTQGKICSRRTARHRGTPRESSARMRPASPQPARSTPASRSGVTDKKTSKDLKGSHLVSTGTAGEKTSTLHILTRTNFILVT